MEAPTGAPPSCGIGGDAVSDKKTHRGRFMKGGPNPSKKGTTNNPGGRPKALADVIEAARAHTTAAVETLAVIMLSCRRNPATNAIEDHVVNEKMAPASGAAAVALLNRGWGKDTQPIDLTVTGEVHVVTRTLVKPQADGSVEVQALPSTSEMKPA